MLLGPKGAGVFDFDAICATHPAMDIARFAAVIVRREPARLDRAEAALARLLDSYGDVPPDLDWWLAAQILCQVGSPFRKAWADWPRRSRGSSRRRRRCWTGVRSATARAAPDAW